MLKVITKSKEIVLSEIGGYTPVFAKRHGKLIGMLVKENNGWILRVGGPTGSSGHYATREELIEYEMNKLNTEFFVEEE